MRCGAAAGIIRPVTITIRVAPPVPTAGLELSDRDDLIARVRHEIELLVQENKASAHDALRMDAKAVP
jgi:hypothetical protein